MIENDRYGCRNNWGGVEKREKLMNVDRLEPKRPDRQGKYLGAERFSFSGKLSASLFFSLILSSLFSLLQKILIMNKVKSSNRKRICNPNSNHFIKRGT